MKLENIQEILKNPHHSYRYKEAVTIFYRFIEFETDSDQFFFLNC